MLGFFNKKIFANFDANTEFDANVNNAASSTFALFTLGSEIRYN